jgi:hypothetical protein
MLLLIGSGSPPPEPPEPDPAPPDWPRELLSRSWRLLAGLGLALLSSAFPPIEAYALLLAACVLIGRGLGHIVQGTPGLKDHRQ